MSTFTMQEQDLDQWCWAAVAVSVANYLKPDPSRTQCEVAGSVLNTNCCPDLPACDEPQALTDALDAVNCHAGNPIPGAITFAQIQQAIDAGWPIPVRIVWEDNPANAHFVVISGYALSNNGNPLVQVDDPFYGRSIVDYDTFVSSYQGAGSWQSTYKTT